MSSAVVTWSGPRTAKTDSGTNGRFPRLSKSYFATAFGLKLSLMSFAVPTLLITAWIFFANSALAATYNTYFPNSENPISEGGNWKNRALEGVEWTNCRTGSGLVYSTESGTNSNRYGDSTYILTGTWGPLHTVEATVFSHNQNDAYFQEVALRLHSTMTAHTSTGYEVLFRVRHPGGMRQSCGGMAWEIVLT